MSDNIKIYVHDREGCRGVERACLSNNLKKAKGYAYTYTNTILISFVFVSNTCSLSSPFDKWAFEGVFLVGSDMFSSWRAIVAKTGAAPENTSGAKMATLHVALLIEKEWYLEAAAIIPSRSMYTSLPEVLTSILLIWGINNDNNYYHYYFKPLACSICEYVDSSYRAVKSRGALPHTLHVSQNSHNPPLSLFI